MGRRSGTRRSCVEIARVFEAVLTMVGRQRAGANPNACAMTMRLSCSGGTPANRFEKAFDVAAGSS
jgi:hypothetical protein